LTQRVGDVAGDAIAQITKGSLGWCIAIIAEVRDDNAGNASEIAALTRMEVSGVEHVELWLERVDAIIGPDERAVAG
jgi:hypothetical protein